MAVPVASGAALDPGVLASVAMSAGPQPASVQAIDDAARREDSPELPAIPQLFWSSLAIEEPGYDPATSQVQNGAEKSRSAKEPATPASGGRMTGAAIRAAAKPAPDLPGPQRNAGREIRPRAPMLNLDSVATSSTPAHVAERSGRSRLFHLEHCPVYRPTLEEFSQPLTFIEKVARESEDCGIAKIIPPDGWKPDFALDTELFRFRTRLQRLNSMEAASRASVNFLEQLHAFHSTRGSARASIPIIYGKPINLFALRREVDRLGGFGVVSESRQWSTVARALGYTSRTGPGVAMQLKSAYVKIIQPFEQLRSAAPAASTSKSPFALTKTPQTARPARMSESPTNIANGSPVTIGRVQEAAAKLNAALRMSPDHPIEDVPPMKARTTTKEDEVCQFCYTMERESPLLLCEDCDRAYHMSCLSPPLSRVPEDDWFCDECILATGDDFGFEEGPEHSVHSYQRRADLFRQRWLDAHPPKPMKAARTVASPGLNGHSVAPPKPALLKSEPAYTFLSAAAPKQPKKVAATVKAEPGTDDATIGASPATAPATAAAASGPPEPTWDERLHLEDHFEREFWRVVESQTETVEVEYGADLHVRQYGSGFPTLEQHPNNAYSRDGWNLNNLPVAPGSVLRYVSSDIAGMTSPWIYFGMLFSAFAWHKEDHHTYSINYQHLGATKTWYGVPGSDEQKLEAAMRDAAPELFEQTPDLMYQLTTLMSPGRIKRAGVPVFACDQRPNEIVVTFPGAYHTGFNHGLNVNEAVNFALPDWIVHGLTAVVRYRGLAKAPVFSHDQLLVSIYTHDKTPRTSRWLLMSFREMVDREANDRSQVRAREDVTEILHEVEPADESFQCSRCRAYAYLSHIILAEQADAASAEPPRVVCTIHADELGPGPKLLRLRFSDHDLTLMANRVQSRSSKAAAKPGASLLPMPAAPPPVVDPNEPRASKRKRRPTAALLAAMDEADDDIEPDPLRRKLWNGGEVPPGVEPRYDLMIEDEDAYREDQ